MKKDSFLKYAKVAALFVFMFVGMQTALAQPIDIVYPVSELGGCADRTACKAYCSKPRLACVDFAESHGLVGSEEAAEMRAMIKEALTRKKNIAKKEAVLQRDDLVGSVKRRVVEEGNYTPAPGPPQRDSRDQEPRIDEEKALAAIDKYGGPGGCTDMNSCSSFCDTPDNSEVCFAFAKEHNLMVGGDLEKFEKMVNMVGPGGCRGRECEAYCDAPGHEDECFAFAKENGLILIHGSVPGYNRADVEIKKLAASK